jgi:hypothetical protein
MQPGRTSSHWLTPPFIPDNAYNLLHKIGITLQLFEATSLSSKSLKICNNDVIMGDTAGHDEKLIFI